MTDENRLGAVEGNRLSLDFVNLPFTPGDPAPHTTSWLELIDFLAGKGIVSEARGEELRNLPENDPRAAESLLHAAERLGNGLRAALRAATRNDRIHREWVEPVNERS